MVGYAGVRGAFAARRGQASGYESACHLWPRVARLVNAQSTATRQRNLRKQPPGRLMNLIAGDPMLLHAFDELLDVVHDEVQLVLARRLCRMHRNFRWGQPKDQPS